MTSIGFRMALIAKSINYEMIWDRKIMKLRYEDIPSEVERLLGCIEEHNMWSCDYSEPPGVQRHDGRIRKRAL